MVRLAGDMNIKQISEVLKHFVVIREVGADARGRRAGGAGGYGGGADDSGMIQACILITSLTL